jgi:integrase
MPSVHIITRTTRGGAKRYFVRYRLGGRESALRHGGVFPTMREASERARWIGGELAARRVPDLSIERPVGVTLGTLTERYLATRIDASDKTLKTYRQAFTRLGALAEREPTQITVADVQEWVGALARDGLSPATVRKYLDPLRQALDFAEVEPNPARSARLRLPRAKAEEANPPSLEHVRVLVETLPARYRLPVRGLEATGLRLGELAGLTWGDLDFRASRLRVARNRTKGGTAGRRWVPIPITLLAEIADLVPAEDRDLSAPLFPDLSHTGLRNAMTRACRFAGIPAYSPHDLRHRYISLLVLAGVPLPIVRQVVGHARASVTLDVYSHVLLDEPPELLAERRRLVMERDERIPRDAPVMPRDSSEDDETRYPSGFPEDMGDTGLEPVTPSLSSWCSPN